MSGPAAILVGVFALFLGAMALIYWAGVRSSRRAHANLTGLAARLGLTLHEKRVLKLVTELALTGTVQGRSVRVWHYSTGSGKSQRAWAAIGVRVRESDALTFRFAPQHRFSKVLERIGGAKEMTLGDPAFDDAWHLQTNQADFLRAALVPTIRQRMMTLLQSSKSGHLRLEKGEVIYAEPGSFSTDRLVLLLEAQLPLLLDLADVADVAGESQRR